MSNNKLYGYFVDNVLKKVSSSKELLQEILMDDYYEDAFYLYYVERRSRDVIERFETLTPYKFWHEIKKKNTNKFNMYYFPSRFIKDLEEYRVE